MDFSTTTTTTTTNENNAVNNKNKRKRDHNADESNKIMKRDMLKGVKIIVPEIFSDERGNFSENFNQKKFN